MAQREKMMKNRPQCLGEEQNGDFETAPEEKSDEDGVYDVKLQLNVIRRGKRGW